MPSCTNISFCSGLGIKCRNTANLGEGFRGPLNTEANVPVSYLRHLIKYTRSFLSSGDVSLVISGRELHAVMMENSLGTGLNINYDSFQVRNTYLNKCKKLDYFSLEGINASLHFVRQIA